MPLFIFLTPTSNKALQQARQRDIGLEMQRMAPEAKNSPGWIVQRFGGVSVRKFGVKIVEDIVKFVFSRYYTFVKAIY